MLVHWESYLQGILNPCDRAGSCRLGQPGPRARTTITVVPQNPKPGPKCKGWRQKSKPRCRSVASRRRPSPSEPGETRMAVDCGESWPSNADSDSEGAEPGAKPKEAGPESRWSSTAGKAGRPMPKALSPVPTLRRRARGQGRDSRRLRGNLKPAVRVQCHRR